MTAIRSRLVFLFPLLGIGLASLLLIGISQAQAQEGTPTPEPEEIPLAPTPMAPPEEPPMQAMAQAQQSPTPSEDRIIDDEPDNSIRPVIAYSAEGDVYLAVWQDTLDFVPTNIFARYVDAQGNPMGSRFLVSGPRPGRVHVRVVAGGGVFSVLWQEGQDQYRGSVYVQRVDGSFSDSPLLGSALLVHTPVEDQFQAVFNPDRNEFLLVWLDPRNSVLASYLRGEVYGRRMTPGGVLDTAEVNFTPVPANPSLNDILNAPSAENDLSAAYNPSLAQYLLTYGTYYCTNLNCLIREEVRARRIDAASLARIGNPIFITPNPNRIQWAARASYDPRLQQYVVFWNDNRALESDMTIYVQKINAQGSLIGTNQALISEPGSQLWPEVTYLDVDSPSPRYFLAWEDDPGTQPHFTRGAFLLDNLSVDVGVLDLSTEADSSQQVPQPASDHQPVPNLVAVWQHIRPGHSADVHATQLSSLARHATLAVLDEDGVSILPWDRLADTSVLVEARLTALTPNHPDNLAAVITAQQSGQRTLVPLAYEGVVGGAYIYRSSRLQAALLVNRPTELTVAAVVNAHIEEEYAVAQTFMDRLGVPANLRRGIAWGTGDMLRGRAPASSEFFLAAGFENASVNLLGYTAIDEFFLKNQADVLFYVGEGYHFPNIVLLYDAEPPIDASDLVVGPAEVGGNWSDVDVAVFGSCSVLDINNYNLWAERRTPEGETVKDFTSPGKKWLQLVPGPETWIGFQWKAPLLFEDQGDQVLYALADRYAAGDPWVNAWRTATSGEITDHKSVGAVAIEDCVYYYWKAYFIEILGVRMELPYYTWEQVSCSEWNSSAAGLEITVASPVDVHIYDNEGRHVGPNGLGGYDTEIPGSRSWTTSLLVEEGAPKDAERISIRPADLSLAYDVLVAGTGEGTFDLFLEIPDRSSQVAYEVAYLDVPVTPDSEFSLELGPIAETDFVLVGLDGQVIQPTSILTSSLDLPVHVALSGTQLDSGWFEGSATATLSPSARSDLPELGAYEYDLGAGWQLYDAPVVINAGGENLFRYRGVFADGSRDATQEIVVRVQTENEPPLADAGPDQDVPEGDIVTLSASGSTDPDGDPLTYTWELVDANGPEVLLSSTNEVSPSFLAPDDATYLFRVTVADGKGGVSSDEVGVTVDNVLPSISAFVVPADPTPVGTSVAAAAGFSDPGTRDTHTATWAWGDGTSSEAIVDEGSGEGTVAGAHAYSMPGVYTIRLTVVDQDGGATFAEYRYLVIYDPAGGFVTAGGWFQTPSGSYADDPSLAGKANFGLNARYKDGEPLPSGQTQFSLQGGDLRFHSSAYHWLVVASGLAQIKGTGTVNGQPGYSFMITMTDGDVAGGDGRDRIRVRIRVSSSGETVYDSQMGEPEDASPSSPLGGGSVVIHE